MTDKLSLYNGALSAIGERRLKSLSEKREPRFVLDDIWDRGAVNTCLQLGQWNFGIRSIQIDADPTVTPAFGYQKAFAKPSDLVRLAGLCSDEYFRQAYGDYSDESGYWWSDITPIYVRYVSSDSQYGSDYSLWPENFTRMVEHYLAKEANPRITHTQTKQRDIDDNFRHWKKEAKATDAMDEAMKSLPPGSWGKSRHGRYRRDDRGSRTEL